MGRSSSNTRTPESISAELVTIVPEIRLRYEQELRWWRPDRPGPHIVFGDVLVPYIRQLCDTGDSGAVLPRIFEFLETLASSEREGVREVVAVSVLEPLLDDEERRIRVVERHMGSTTRALADSLRSL